MKTQNSNTSQHSNKGFFHILELLIETTGWLRIVASPLIVSLIIGAFIYFPNPNTPRLICGILVVLTGLMIGVIWATKVWKKSGTISFLARIMATPELNKPDEDLPVKNKDR